MSDPREALTSWYQRVTQTQRAHYLSAEHYSRRRYWLGVPAVLLSTLVGTSVFATIQKQPETWLQILVGLASVAAALLASLQTFLGYSERAEKHRVVGARYGALGRELEQLLTSPDQVSYELVTEVRKRLDQLALESPNNPQHIYKRADLKVSE